MKDLWSRLLQSLLIVSSTLPTFVSADPPPTTLEPFYYVHKDPPTGGCTDAQVAWLSDAYGEAIIMIRQANDAIDFVKKGRSPTDVGLQQQWDKTAALLIDIFEIHVHPEKGVTDPDQFNRLIEIQGKSQQTPQRNQIITAFPQGGIRAFGQNAKEILLGVYDQMESAADNPPPGPARRKTIFCNANMITYLRPNDEIPSGPDYGHKVSEIYPKFEGSEGLFWQNAITYYGQFVSISRAESAKPVPPATVPRVEDTYCPTPNTQAQTSRSVNRLIFCPRAFVGRDGSNTVAKAETSLVVEGLQLDDLFAGSRLFVHELVHLWNPIGDQLAVNMSAPRPSATDDNPKPSRPKVSGNYARKVYYWDQCYNLADEYPEETSKTAETYAIFATAQYFSEWRWQSEHGKAVKITEPMGKSTS